jgi:hypothetical protein
MYTVYKITNNLNGKFYIGVHKTENPNDLYMGSGRAIKEAIKKHGKENFSKSIILITENKNQAYDLEKKLTENFVENNNYNMRLGGVGGFTKENAIKGNIKSRENVENSRKGGLKAKELGYSFGGVYRDPIENGRKGGLANKGKRLSPEHIQSIKDAWIRKKSEA